MAGFVKPIKMSLSQTPVRIDIGGTVESIQEINVDILYKCYNTFTIPAT